MSDVMERGSGLSQYVKDIFEEFRQARIPYEELWKECWYNFLGQYQPELVWRKKTEGTKGRSRIFIKLTTVKCHTAHSKISDVLFSGRNVMPFDVEVLEPQRLGVPVEVVQEAERRMKERLKDHFKRIWLKKKMDVAVLEMAIFGTAVLKGPVVRMERRPAVRLKTISNIPVTEFDSNLSPYEMVMVNEMVPDIDRVPIWNYFVDPNARTNRDSIAEIHFERMNPARFRMLAGMRGFDAEAVKVAAERAVATTEDEELRYVQLGENYAGEFGQKDKRVSVLEYWGLVPVALLKEAGCEGLEGYRDGESVEAKVVLGADGVVLKACVNHLGIRPFFVCPWKEKPGQIYGTGVAEAMRDSQKMINSAARLIIDNKALSGNGMVAINLDRINTKRTKNLDVYAGKTWYIKGNFSPREVIDSVAFPDVTYGLRELMEMFERFADEETGIPKYTHGLQDSFLNKTATGMSMLMTQANINLKTVIENIDDYWIEPIVEAFGQWMQEFGEDPLLRMPFRYKATGTDSMIAKEIKMENYMRFLQITSNPQDAIFMDRVKLMKQIARLLETEDVLRSDDEIEKLLQQMGQLAESPADLRQRVSIEKLYPMLTRGEQIQILKQIGIEPDEEVNQPAPQGQDGMSPPIPAEGQVPPVEGYEGQ